MNFFKLNVAAILIILFCCIGIGFTVQAQGLKNAFNNVNTVADTGGYLTTISAESMIAKIINVVLSTLGAVFLILMIYGGYFWMTASGEEQRVTKAKNLITAAIIGMIIVISAYVIAYFVVEQVSTGVLK